jgi:hypothetical protein
MNTMGIDFDGLGIEVDDKVTGLDDGLGVALGGRWRGCGPPVPTYEMAWSGNRQPRTRGL